MTNRNYHTAQQGLTIIELMVSLVIASVMMAYALPAFDDFTTQRRATSNVNAFVGAINYARNEATRVGGTVSVQAMNSADAGDEWGPGFCVTVGNPGNCTNPVPLRNFPTEGGVTIDAVLNDQSTLVYNARGMLAAGVPETVQLCGADTDEDPGRVVNINAVGRPSTRNLVCYP